MGYNYSSFPVTDDWAKDINQYAMTCQGHERQIDQKLEAKRTVVLHSEPTGQIALIHDAEVAALEARKEFWSRQGTAAAAGYLLEDGGSDPEWANRHQALRAEASRFARLMYPKEYDAYVCADTGQTRFSDVGPY